MSLKINDDGELQRTDPIDDFKEILDNEFIECCNDFDRIDPRNWKSRVKYICRKYHVFGLEALVIPVTKTIRGESHRIGFDNTPTTAKDFNNNFPSWVELNERLNFAIEILARRIAGKKFADFNKQLSRSGSAEQRLLKAEFTKSLKSIVGGLEGTTKMYYQNYRDKTQVFWPDLDYGYSYFEPLDSFSVSELEKAAEAIAVRKLEVYFHDYLVEADLMTENKAIGKRKKGKKVESKFENLSLKDLWLKEHPPVSYEDFIDAMTKDKFLKNGKWNLSQAAEGGILMCQLTKYSDVLTPQTEKIRTQDRIDLFNNTFSPENRVIKDNKNFREETWLSKIRTLESNKVWNLLASYGFNHILELGLFKNASKPNTSEPKA